MSFKPRMQQVVDSYQGMPPAHLLAEKLRLQRVLADTTRKLAAVRRAMKNQLREKS